MRILHVNKFLYRRGGAEGYLFDVAERQRAAGHEVAFFGMAHEENLPMPYARHFPSRVDFEPPPAGAVQRARAVGRMVWSRSAAAGIAAVLEDFRPDVAHLHNVYHQLSPSILRPLAARRVPVVMTLHDYKLACPTYRFLDHGEICEACLPHRFWEPLRRRCNGGSLGASAVSAAELSIHTLLGAYGPVDRFVCPSRFLLEKMRAGKVYPTRLRHLPNFVDVDAVEPKGAPGGGIVYAGRLSDEKGVDTLIDAVGRDPGLALDVAGDGPARDALERLAAEGDAAGRVRFHGRLATPELQTLLRASSVAVVPSRWYENMPLAVLEAFGAGLPVVATGLGGLPELIEPGVDGTIVPPNDADALAAALRSYVDDPDRAFEMGRAARRKAAETYNAAGHLERLGDIYAEAGAPR
jgi:glycosyltransferase involved in cell wall biosynthesis